MLSLTPVIHPSIQKFLEDEQCVFSLVKQYGSPLNILFPHIVQENIAEFKNLLDAQEFRSKVHYAHKPNKSFSILKSVYNTGIGVDVASLSELKQACAADFQKDNIEATGPKNDAFIQRGLQEKIIFNADSITEVKQIAYYAKQNKIDGVPILVRLEGFSTGHTVFANNETRFGILLSELDDLFNILKENKDTFDFRGFSFHINASGKKEKITAIENTIDALRRARTMGFTADIMDIGGGFHINYLAHENQWHDYVSALKQSVLGKHERLTWNDSGLGLKNNNGTLAGSPTFVDFFQSPVKAQELNALLDTPLPSFGNSPLKDLLADLLITLMIEPGRALLDQVGITIAEVLDIKKTTAGDSAIIVDMNRSNINSIDLPMMVDPVLVTKTERQKETFGAFIAGNLCLPGDIIYRHKTFFSCKPQRGDVLVFINTAAYNMDFAESATLQQPIAKKVIANLEDKKNFTYDLE